MASHTKKTESEKVEEQDATPVQAEPAAVTQPEVEPEPVAQPETEPEVQPQRQAAPARVVLQPQRQAAPQPPAPKKPVAPVPQMGFLGVRCREGGSASLPVVVKSAGVLIGVVVLQDPSYGGDNLSAALEQAGYPGPFTYHTPGEFSTGVKADVAKAISGGYRTPGLDHKSALRAFGYGQ